MKKWGKFKLVIVLLFIITFATVKAATLYCGVRSPSGTNVCSNSVTMPTTAGTTSATCNCVWTIACPEIGDYTRWTYTNDAVSWVLGSNTANPSHVHYGTTYADREDNAVVYTCDCVDDYDCGTCKTCNSVGRCVNAASNTDPKSECAATWNSCDSSCVRRGGDGYCDGSGSCDTNDRTGNIAQGYYCSGGSEVSGPCNSVWACTNDDNANNAYNNGGYEYQTQGYCDGSGSCDWSGSASEPDNSQSSCECEVTGTQGTCSNGESDCWDSSMADCCGDDGTSDDWCDGISYSACVDGTYRTDADTYSVVCECGVSGTQDTCSNGEAGCWDSSMSDCCGDDGTSDDWCDGTSYSACVDGTYRTDADTYSAVCECGVSGTQDTCSNGETGCWDTSMADCCGDDGTSDDWCDGTSYSACVDGTYRTDADSYSAVCECGVSGTQGTCNNGEVGCWTGSSCCGDDSGENHWETDGVGSGACCGSGYNCVDSGNNCRDQYGTETSCTDGIDNDCDGNSDCSDTNCASSPSCPENCIDGIDNDADGFIDCADAECTQGNVCNAGFCCGSGCSTNGGSCSCASKASFTCSDGNCNTYSEACCVSQIEHNLVCSGTSLTCSGGQNTCEQSCGASSGCDEQAANSCVSGYSSCGGATGCVYYNDGDSNSATCECGVSGTQGTCDNGEVGCWWGGSSCCGDDSGENHWETDGVGSGACCPSGTNCVDGSNVCRNQWGTETSCSDGIDNDCDGNSDCSDSDCTAICPENCNNGIDDDADTYVDCADAECTQGMTCNGGFCCGSGCASNGGSCSCASTGGFTCLDGNCNTYNEDCCNIDIQRSLQCSGTSLVCSGGAGTCEANNCGASLNCDEKDPGDCATGNDICGGANGCTQTSCGTTPCSSDVCDGVSDYYDYAVYDSGNTNCPQLCIVDTCTNCDCTPISETCIMFDECNNAVSNCNGGTLEKCHLDESTEVWVWDSVLPSETDCEDGFNSDCDSEVDEGCQCTDNFLDAGVTSVDAILLIDKSGSMNSKITPTYTRIQMAKLAANNFIDGSSWQATDTLGIVTYGSGTTIEHARVPVTAGNKVSLKSAVNNIATGGATYIGTGIQTALSQLSGGTAPNKFIVILGDGQQNGGVDPITQANLAAASNVVIYTIATGNENIPRLQQIAQITSGKYFYAATGDEILEIFMLIQREITGDRPCGVTWKGECTLGSQVCVGDVWQGCTPFVEPAPEICDSLDNDCDGLVDEGLGCCVAGAEVCDGIDNDCNSLIDEILECNCLDQDICNDGIDNDCDTEWDYDTSDWGPPGDIPPHGDDDCAITVTGISVSDINPCPNDIVQVNCTVDVGGINSVSAYLDHSLCSWTSWNGNTALFDCNVPGFAGNYLAECAIDLSKSYQAGSNQSMLLTAGGPSCCAGYGTIPACGSDASCEWCPDCNGPMYSGDVSRCVISGNCLYYCWRGECGATCDLTNGGCDVGWACNVTHTCQCYMTNCNPDTFGDARCCDDDLGAVIPDLNISEPITDFDFGSCGGGSCYGVSHPQNFVANVYELECCQDDPNEYFLTRLANESMDRFYASNPLDNACCNQTGLCVDSDRCISDNTDVDGDGDLDECSGGIWVDCQTGVGCIGKGLCIDGDCNGEWMNVFPVIPVGYGKYNLAVTPTRTVVLDIGFWAGATVCRYINHDNPGTLPDPDDTDWTAWEECVSQRYWLTNPDDGLKTVYVQVNYTGTGVIMNGSITLDTTGCLIDITPPSAPVIDDGIYTNSNSTVRIKWQKSEDIEQGLLEMPIEYIYALTDGSTVLYSGMTEELEFTATGLNLAHGTTLYANITARNCANLTSSTVSDGLIVDLVPPFNPLIDKVWYDETGWKEVSEDKWYNTRKLMFIWSGQDDLSPEVGAYSYVLTKDINKSPDYVPEGKIGYLWNETETVFNSLSSGIYFFRVRSRDKAGNWGPYSEKKIKVDNTPPDRSWILSQSTDPVSGNITFVWVKSNDPESGIYTYMINISSMIEDVSFAINDTNLDYNVGTTGEFNATIGVQNGAGQWRWTHEISIETDFDPPVITGIPTGTVNTITPLLIVSTNEQAICTYDHSGIVQFRYTNSTYHESQITVTDGQAYNIDVTCADMSGNWDTITLSFTVNAVLGVDTIEYPVSFSSYDGMSVNMSVKLLNGSTYLEQVAANRFELYIDGDEADFTVAEIGGGNYNIFFSSPETGSHTVELFVDGVSVTSDLTTQDIFLNVEYSGPLNSPIQLSNIAYDENSTLRYGIASHDSASGGASWLAASDTDSLYIFAGNLHDSFNLRNGQFAQGTFEDLVNPSFGYSLSQSYVTMIILSYDNIKIYGSTDLIFRGGYYDLVLENTYTRGNQYEIEVSKATVSG